MRIKLLALTATILLALATVGPAVAGNGPSGYEGQPGNQASGGGGGGGNTGYEGQPGNQAP